MQFLFNYLKVLCVLFIQFVCTYTQPISLPLSAMRINMVGPSNCLLSSDGGFILTDLKQNKTRKLRECSLVIGTDINKVSINGRWLTSRTLIVEPVNGVILVNGREYCGSFMVYPSKEGFVGSVAGSVYKPYGQFVLHMAENKNNEKSNQLDQLDALEKVTVVPQVVLPKAHSFKVRVLLDECGSQGMWRLSAKSGFVLWDPGHPKKKIKLHEHDVVISVRSGNLYFNNKKFLRDIIYIKPVQGDSYFDGSSYHGAFIVMQNKDRTMLINCVDLEEYVSCVLLTESWPGWPLEVNKVFAIACRTYVVAMAMRAKKNNNPYHVKNTNLHQTYGGTHTNAILRRAVADTQGVFLAHNNKPIIAMFDSCCGGIIPAYITGFDFIKAPYLARNYACVHCKECQLYAWQVEFELHEFERQIGQRLTAGGPLKDIKINKKDKAGLVQEIILKSGKKAITLTGKKLYSLIKEVKSFCFGVQKKQNKVIVKGRGYGHHLGLCQWGARQMVRDGWHHQRILQFYYPGTNFMRVS